jgi:uncharacterized paraquat-inducible protein A
MEDAELMSSKRKKLLINPEFQLSFLTYTLGIAATILVVFFGANRFFFWRFKQKGIDIGLPADHVFFRFINEQQWNMDLIFLVTAVIALAALIFYGLYLSNRIAGPIYHLETHLQKRLSGEKTPALKFRTKDYFKELEDPVNRLLPPEK